MTHAAWILLHLCLGLSVTWLARRYALRRALVDHPGERRSHAAPTPRGGGISIAVSLLAAALWLWARTAGPAWLPGFTAGLVLVALVGLVDDHRPLSPWLRLAVHAVAASCLAASAWLATGDPGLALLAFAAAMVLTNVWNFMDGIDGLAATQAMLAALAVAMLATGDVRWLALALLGATAGFLPFNLPRASVFLGDVGSGALGYAIAGMVAMAAATAPDRAWALALPLSAFLIDAGMTLAGRMWRGEPWWRPHVLHAYQRWVRRCGSHLTVTLAYGGWTLASLALAWLLLRSSYRPSFVIGACAAWYTAGAIAWWMLQGKGTDAAMENRE
jgi:UDP-N-acetylmuramyl pentapeptide phosphotransferase/UDP-N-acetylglucosamine-1-phosphate transferase